MTGRTGWILHWGLVLASICVAACAPAATNPGGTADAEAAPTAPVAKALHIALVTEPTALGGKFGGGGTGGSDYDFIFHAQLAQYDATGTPMPVLLARLPSLDDGSWKVYADGTMDTTYQLRPNTTWHDGTPFTAADVQFTVASIMNPALPSTNQEPEKYVGSLDVLDPQTFVVHWKEPYIFANVWALEPIPRHIFEPLAQRDLQSFANASAWGRDWAGLGPYQVTDWVQGSYLRGRAFQGFVLGAPKIADLFIYFIADPSQAVAQMLAGTIDVTLGNTIRVDEGILLKEQMEARGEASVMTIPTKIRYGEVQYRDPQAPAARDVRVRQGMMNALDRQALVDALLRGFTTPADVYLTPNDAAYAASDRVIAKYPFDVNRALALWQNAGWTRGSDGVLRNASGERFDLEVRTTDGAQNVKEGQVLSDFWKQAGINTSLEVVPIAKQNDQEYRAKYPGVSISATSISPDWLAKWQTSEAATEATHWKGGNRGAYSRPELDQMYRQYITTVDPQQRNDRLVQLVKLTSEDVTYLPLYYQVDVHVIRTGLKGLVPRWPGQSGMAFNAYEWSWQ